MPAISLCRDFFFPPLRDDVTFISDFNDWFGRVTRPHSLYPRRKATGRDTEKDDRKMRRRTSRDRGFINAVARRHYSAISRGNHRVIVYRSPNKSTHKSNKKIQNSRPRLYIGV